jgi:hypothetical protein
MDGKRGTDGWRLDGFGDKGEELGWDHNKRGAAEKRDQMLPPSQNARHHVTDHHTTPSQKMNHKSDVRGSLVLVDNRLHSLQSSQLTSFTITRTLISNHTH